MKHKQVLLKLLTLELVLLATIPLSSYAYSLWYESLLINVQVKMGELNLKIGSCKAVSCCRNVEFKCVKVDDEVYLIIEKAYPGWEGWFGLVIVNEGSIPVMLRDVRISREGALSQYISISAMYFYGPYKRGFREVWGRVKCEDLPFKGYINPPVEVDLGEKVIVWAKIVIKDTAPYGASGSLSIKLEFTPSI